MKTPLRYQVTEYDCGTVSLLNAVCYLFKRSDIPTELVKAIHLYTVDCYGTDGKKSNEWMPNESINKMCKWIAGYSAKYDFKLNAVYLRGEEVNYTNIERGIRSGGVVFIKCWRNEPQYVIFTNVNELNTYIFDSYYCEDAEYEKDDDVRVIQSKPAEYNRIVRTDRVFSETKKDFSLGAMNERECVLLNNK